MTHSEERSPRDGIVETVPPGTVVVSELPTDPFGVVVEDAESGWYALDDSVALASADIVEPTEETDALGRPGITFGFTDEGRQDFQELTRQVAQRGQGAAIGPVTSEEAELLSGHFAILVDNEVQTRPIINLAEARTGSTAGTARTSQAPPPSRRPKR